MAGKGPFMKGLFIKEQCIKSAVPLQQEVDMKPNTYKVIKGRHNLNLNLNRRAINELAQLQ